MFRKGIQGNFEGEFNNLSEVTYEAFFQAPPQVKFCAIWLRSLGEWGKSQKYAGAPLNGIVLEKSWQSMG